MKKTLFYLVLALFPLLVACGGDDDQEELIKWPDSLTLHVGESFDLKAAQYFTFDDDFVLTTTSNMEFGGTIYRVVGWHVGETILHVVSDRDRVNDIKVTVLGNYNCFPDPVVDWLSSIEHVKAEHQGGELLLEAEPDEENPFYIVAYKSFEKAEYIAYLFDAEKRQLIGVSIEVKKDDWNDVKKHLQERFKLIIDGRYGNFALAGVNTASLVNINQDVEYQEGQWIDVYTRKPSVLFFDGDYTVSFTSRLTEDNYVEITYLPNWNKLE